MASSTARPIEISVIVPVQNRADLLRPTLLSLARQTLGDDRFEVIVVDDGSDVPVAVDLPWASGRGPLVRTLRNGIPSGAGAARNRGAEHASGRVLLFVDAECVAHPGLLEAHVRAHERRAAAYCSHTSGREVTPEQWSVRFGYDWDFTDTAALFDRVEQTPELMDPLGELLAVPHPSDWAYFWTTAASVPADAFWTVGGFSAAFAVKGVEDMELAYRLAHAGVPTIFLPEARCLHQPHERSRFMEILRDRRNDHVLLATHPDPVVETVVGFGITAARSLMPVLTGFRQRLTPASADCARLARLDVVSRLLRDAAGETLLLGHPARWPETLRRAGQIVFPSDDPEADIDHRLIGVRLPYQNGTFALGVVTDYWRHFPERVQARLFDELLRTCREVVVLSQSSTSPPKEGDADLAAALELFDRPYWEFAVRLRREWHEFSLAPLDSAGSTRAFRLTAREWPRADLATVLS
jgi:GT2 family glycosyltransferase